MDFGKRVLFANQDSGQEGPWGEPAPHRSIIITKRGYGPLTTSAGGGDKNLPHPNPAQCWATRPSPRLCHPALHFRKSLDGDVRKQGAG